MRDSMDVSDEIKQTTTRLLRVAKGAERGRTLQQSGATGLDFKVLVPENPTGMAGDSTRDPTAL
jgi:hypothetical protein